MLYSISGLTMIYNNRKVIDIASLNIEKKRIYALIGPNGAGKTTLLKMLAFLESPSTGIIRYCGNKVRFSESFLQPLRKKVVMVSQNPVMFTKTVYKNMEFGLKVRKISAKKRKAIIDQALDMVDMRQFANAMAHRLSSGETQRVALARAIALSPDVILCDEPISNVDIENQRAIVNLLQQINREKKVTLVFTTHDKLYAASLANHILFLNKGELSRASYENFFTAFLTEKDDQHATCRIHNRLPLIIQTDKRGAARLMIDPEKIEILISEQSGNKEKNCFKGEISQITGENGKIRVIVKAGIFITILVNREEYMEKKPMVGENISFLIPDSAIDLIS